MESLGALLTFPANFNLAAALLWAGERFNANGAVQ
jgi:hypothetical protein